MDSAVNVRLPHRIQHYFTEVSNHRQYVKKYRTYGHQTYSILRNFSPDIDPCVIIAKFVQAQLDRAMANARRNGHEPYWIGVCFKVPGKEFLVKFEREEVNRAGRIIGEFEKFHQSAKRLEVADQPVDLRITIVADVRGAGYTKKMPTNPPAFEPDAIIRVPERDDNLCLPVSIVIAMQNTKMCKNGSRQRKDTNALKRLLKNPKRQVNLAKQLLADAGLPDDRDDYGLDDIGAIQTVLDRQTPGKFSIIVFAAGAAEIPVFKGPTNAEHLLAIFNKDGHYKPLKSAAKLFGTVRRAP
ncbi:hypothetical protein AAVH_22710 [Aphelenchoides avenae]|nr:hypothetical protein AAVH_22710 [Aphelenchus avenae]